MSLLRYLQIAFTAKNRCFRFPRKESCYSPASATSLATVLASPCFCAGAVDPVRLPAQLFAVEPMQSPHADVLSISSMNAHLELCPFSPAIANLQGTREQTLPGGKKRRFYCGSAHTWLSHRVLREKPPLPWGVPGCHPHRSSSLRWLGHHSRANIASMNAISGAFSFDPAGLLTSIMSWGIAFELNGQFSGAMPRSALSTSRLALRVPR